MRKILAFFLLFAITTTFTACSNNSDARQSRKDRDQIVVFNNENESVSQAEHNYNTVSSPETLMDLFKGERKLWYYIHDYKPAHNSEILLMLVTEDGKVTEAYYKFESPIYGYAPVENIDAKIVIYGKQFVMSDLQGLSDDEIISMFSSNYANIAKTYRYNTVHDSEVVFYAQPTPYEVTYGGHLDSSGNYFSREHVYLLKEDLMHPVSKEFYFDKTVQPTKIKNQEYVGFGSTGISLLLLTKNTYTSFNIKNDDIAGAVDIY